MAEVAIELRDEELLDFDGSEYDFSSEEELERDAAAAGGASSPPQAKPEAGKAESEREFERGRDRERCSRGNIQEPSRLRKHGTKSELEDGELIDMVNSKKQQGEQRGKDVRRSRNHWTDETTTMRSFDREAERTDSRHDRKRRRELSYERDRHYDPRFGGEAYDADRYGSHDRSYRSPTNRFSDHRSRGGVRSYAQDFRPNFSPGIIGPGRPFGPEQPPFIHPSLEASLGRFTPAQLQELLLQEHMLRSQQMMQLSSLGVRAPGPPPPLYRPVVAPEFLRPVPMWGGPEIAPMGLMRPFGRAPRGAAGMIGSDAAYPPRGREPAIRRYQSRAVERQENAEGFSKQTRGRTYEKTTDRDRDRDRVEENSGSRRADAHSSIIQLGGPVQKSRVLTVSGLLENTPVDAVEQAFGKRARLSEIQTDRSGSVFTATYTSVHEALCAKRRLHRSTLAGVQISVEFAPDLSAE